jgi:hypothetical protein
MSSPHAPLCCTPPQAYLTLTFASLQRASFQRPVDSTPSALRPPRDASDLPPDAPPSPPARCQVHSLAHETSTADTKTADARAEQALQERESSGSGKAAVGPIEDFDANKVTAALLRAEMMGDDVRGIVPSTMLSPSWMASHLIEQPLNSTARTHAHAGDGGTAARAARGTRTLQ